MAETKNDNINSKTDSKKKKSKRILPKILWRSSGLLIWLWFLDSIIYKLNHYELFNLPNQILFLLILVPLFCIFTKDGLKIVIYPFYLFFFPFVGIYFLIKIFYYIFKIINRLVKTLTKGIDLFTCTTGAILFFFLFIINQLIIIKNNNINLQIIFAILSLLFLFFLMISIIRWVHDPYRPIKNLQEIIVNIGKRLAHYYFKNSIEPAIETKDPRKIKRGINSVNSFIELTNKLKSKLSVRINISLKKRITMYSTIVFFFFLLIVLFGYSGTIMSLNRLAAENRFQDLLSIQDGAESHNVLFGSLQNDASYLDCIFQSFSIMTISQDFTLTNTSDIGKILILLEIFTTIFIFTQLLSIFSTTMGISDEIKLLSTNDIFDKIFNRLEIWGRELKSLDLNDTKEIVQDK